MHTPKFVASATESGANVFALDYFGRPAYLAQSPQFYKQMLVGVFERVYEVGPVFRAEPHDTVRHLAQYTSLDVELGFIADHRDVMAVLRDTLAGMLAAAGAQPDCGRACRCRPRSQSIHFADALELVGKATGEDLSGEPDLAPAHERWLGEWAQREYGSDFLFVEGYPMAKRPFYTHPDPARPGVLQRLRPALPRASSWSPAGSGCTATRTTSRRCGPVASRPSRTSPIWTRSGTGCRRTAGSRSGWSASSCG